MLLVNVKTKEEISKYLAFRKSIYEKSPYVDDFYFIIKKMFNGKSSFLKNKEVFAFFVEDESKKLLCEGIAIYTKLLPDYIQLSFFESLPNHDEAVRLLLDKVSELGKNRGCRKVVIGTYGHIDYGLGFLYSDFDTKNAFTIGANSQYYNDYFEKLDCEKVLINTYKSKVNKEKFERFEKCLNRIEQRYTFKYLDKKQLDYYSKIFTDINNQAFSNHRYYYERDYQEDREMINTLIKYMPEESVVFAFDGEKPIGMILWHPDFNELAEPGEIFGFKHFLKSRFKKDYSLAQIIEYAVLKEYRYAGLTLGLLYWAYKGVTKYGIKRVESSWVLEENKDSNSYCLALSDGLYKKYICYEKKI